MLLLPIRKTEQENAANEFDMQMSDRSGSMLPTNQMAMSMNAAAAGPMPPIAPSYMAGEGGLLYWEQNCF